MGSAQSIPAQPQMADVCVKTPEVNPLNPKGLKP